MVTGYEQIELNVLQVPDSEQVLLSSIYKSSENILILRKISNLTELQNSWEEVQQFVAGNIQSNLEVLGISDHLAWNIYIVYLVTFLVPYKLENEIESNKFCCKKYIVHVSTLDDDSIIVNEIIGQIPLFAQFEVEGTQAAASSDTIIKDKIFQQSNRSPLARKFLEKQNIEQIVDPIDINQFLDSLEQGEQ